MYLFIRLIEFALKGLFWISVGCLAVGAFFLVSTFVVLIVLGMFTDALLESTVAALVALSPDRGHDRPARAFSRQFGVVATRYSSWGQKKFRRAL